MFRNLKFSIRHFAVIWILAGGTARGQIPQEAESTNAVGPSAHEEQFRQFTEMLSPSLLEGSFTLDGKPAALEEERYELSGVSKLPSGDLWLFKSRIRYGDHDVTVPLPLVVKWADDTPVITLDDLTIPGLGTFSARVVISDGKYAGTWRHGEVAGHLFGQIRKPDSPAGQKEKAATAENSDATEERSDTNEP